MMIDIYCYLYCVTDVYWEITFKVEIIQSLMWSGCGEWNGHNECSFGHNRGICIPPTMSFLVLKKEMQNKLKRVTKLLKSYDQQRFTWTKNKNAALMNLLQMAHINPTRFNAVSRPWNTPGSKLILILMNHWKDLNALTFQRHFWAAIYAVSLSLQSQLLIDCNFTSTVSIVIFKAAFSSSCLFGGW